MTETPPPASFIDRDRLAETLETLTEQLDAAAAGIDVAIVGGHSEYVPALSRPLLSLTAFGRTDRYIPTGGARPGDAVVLTKGAAIEGTGILATDFVADLRAAGVAVEPRVTTPWTVSPSVSRSPR